MHCLVSVQKIRQWSGQSVTFTTRAYFRPDQCRTAIYVIYLNFIALLKEMPRLWFSDGQSVNKARKIKKNKTHMY